MWSLTCRFNRILQFLQPLQQFQRLLRSRLAMDEGVIKSWETLQEAMRHKVVSRDCPADLLQKQEGLVAGLDISYPKDAHSKDESDAYAAVVICAYPSMEVKFQEVQKVHLNAPYVAGFLAFREFPALSSLLSEVLKENPQLRPDVILVDGNGLLHPQRCGVACHIGLEFSIPTIGIAKNLYTLEGCSASKEDFQKLKDVGDYEPLKDKDGCVLGMALKSAKDAKNAIYVSVGHNVSLETAREVVLKCCKFRVPEPLRYADQISRELIRKLEESNNNAKKSC